LVDPPQLTLDDQEELSKAICTIVPEAFTKSIGYEVHDSHRGNGMQWLRRICSKLYLAAAARKR
jgi:hypothetical protein